MIMILKKEKIIVKKGNKARITSQQRIIFDYLKGVKSHPYAEIIYEEVKKKLPQISLGTVYRNLNMLKEKGEIQEIKSKLARYDADVSCHSHFICEKCGVIFDVFEKIVEEEKIKNKKIKFGEIKNFQLYLYGICNKCK